MVDMTKKWEVSLEKMLNEFSLLKQNQEESLETAIRTKEEDGLMVEVMLIITLKHVFLFN